VTDQVCTLLDWDSEFFGLRIARVSAPHLSPQTCDAALAWCQAQAIDCLYLFAPLEDSATPLLAGQHGFGLVDVRLDFARKVAERATPAPRTTIRSFDASDVAALRAIAARSHHATRFYFDPRFPRERCDELYRTWITRSCEGWADGVLVATVDDVPAGYITMHLAEGKAGRIGLVGVDEHARGRRIGTSLVAAAIEWFRDRGAATASVATQARNVAGARLYEGAGFRIAAAGAWYHRWFGARGAMA
jgi:dTDP-4-amino-4,6-dideoxy-D-galactose acyltransferase